MPAQRGWASIDGIFPGIRLGPKKLVSSFFKTRFVVFETISRAANPPLVDTPKKPTDGAIVLHCPNSRSRYPRPNPGLVPNPA